MLKYPRHSHWHNSTLATFHPLCSLQLPQGLSQSFLRNCSCPPQPGSNLFLRIALSASPSTASGCAFPTTPTESVANDLLNIGVPGGVLAARVTTLTSANPTRGRSWMTPCQVSISAPKKSTSATLAVPKTPSRSSAPLLKGMDTTSNLNLPTPSASGSESVIAPTAAGGNFSPPTRLSFGLVLAPSTVEVSIMKRSIMKISNIEQLLVSTELVTM